VTFGLVARFNAISQGTTMSKRELIDTGADKRYVRREEDGKFKVSFDVGRSLSADVLWQSMRTFPAEATRVASNRLDVPPLMAGRDISRYRLFAGAEIAWRQVSC
jgi:hypothetical protein